MQRGFVRADADCGGDQGEGEDADKRSFRDGDVPSQEKRVPTTLPPLPFIF